MRDSSDSPTPAPDPLIGRQIRDLRIVERIGQGGMGAVYKAEHVLLHEPRALKVMHTELFDSVPNAIERFEREARIAVKLRHPNLVLIYDFFVEADHHYLVMEYVVGTSLAAFLREHGALSVEGTCRIGIQCCAGLAHAHEMGIIHRDLSPENVMLATSDAGLSVKIIDFGVARAAFGTRGSSLIRSPDRTLTGANEFIGKPRYASPEQAGALPKGESLDHRSDLYTLGLILYEMATGRPPFEADSPLDYLSHHAHTPPPMPSEIAPDLGIPSALERVILRCLAKDREERYANARELSAALDWAWRASGTEPSRHMPEREAPSRATPAARSRGLAPIAASAALAVLAAGAGAVWWSTRGGEAPALEPPAPAAPPAAVAPPSEPIVADEPVVTPIVPELAPVEPTPELFVAPEPEPAPMAAAPEPEPEPEPAPIAVAPAPVAPPAEPKPEPKPAPPKPAPAKPSVVAFANEGEMKRAFESALAFEKSHPPSAAIANWKEFRGRSPSRDLDEQAKRRITELTLGNLPGL